MTITKLAFVDMETLSLPRAGVPPVPWEVAWITAELFAAHEADSAEPHIRITGSDVFQPMRAAVHLADADPMSLRIGGFYERYQHGLIWGSEADIVDDAIEMVTVDDSDWPHWEKMARATSDHWWVGAVPDFDERIARTEMLRHGLCLATHYHLIDVETYAAGKFDIPLPWTLKRVMDAADVSRSPLGEHTALGDTVDCVRLFAAAAGVHILDSTLDEIEREHLAS